MRAGNSKLSKHIIHANQFVEKGVTGMGNHALITKINLQKLAHQSPTEYPHMECMEAGYMTEPFTLKDDIVSKI